MELKDSCANSLHSCPKEGCAFPSFGGPGARRQCRKNITDTGMEPRFQKGSLEIGGRVLGEKWNSEQKGPSPAGVPGAPRGLPGAPRGLQRRERRWLGREVAGREAGSSWGAS